ncbi:MAG: hypothetical protein IME96_04055 [Proteobacteria bacterium]|nr:hypothetical protein [Pseudomonadota bacterium]
MSLGRASLSLETLVTRVTRFYKIDQARLFQRRRIEPLMSARTVTCFFAIREFNYSGAAAGRYLSMSRAGIFDAVRRGEAIVDDDAELRDKILG